MPEVAEQTKTFDPKEYIANANNREQARRDGKPLPELEKPTVEVKEAPKEPEKPTEREEPEHDRRISRSDRRRLKAFEEAAYWRGRAEAAEASLRGDREEKPEINGDAEPDRKNYATDAEYQRDLVKWEARQEVERQTKTRQSEEADAAWNRLTQEMHQKMVQDAKQFKDWDEVAAKVAEDEDAPQVAEGSQLYRLMEASEFRAHVLYHFAKNPDELQKFIDMGEGPLTIRNFGRLESRLERLYSQEEKKAEPAAQAEKETSEDRGHPAEAKAGRNSGSENNAPKPKPSTEVAARGGSAPPDKPKVGSPAWMAERNRQQFGR